MIKSKKVPEKKIGLLYNFERCRKEGREGRKKLIKRLCIQNYFKVTVVSCDLLILNLVHKFEACRIITTPLEFQLFVRP